MIFDASSLLNQHNGGLVNLASDALGIEICFGPQVFDECTSIQTQLIEGLEGKSLRKLSDESVSAVEYIRLMEDYSLGPGETECLALAKENDLPICCDDRLARRMIENEIGRKNLTGTIGILIRLVEVGAIDPTDAEQRFETMRVNGAFFPDFDTSWFGDNRR